MGSNGQLECSSGKNIEIDLFQENRNSEMKKAIERASKTSGGVTKIVEAFEQQVNIKPKSGMYSHKSSIKDESLISADLRSLRPFKKHDGRAFESFRNISPNQLHHLTKPSSKNRLTDTRKTFLFIVLLQITQIQKSLMNAYMLYKKQCSKSIYLAV